MANPKRNASGDRILSPSRTFFVTTKTSMGKALLQSERNATLLIDVLRFYGKEGKFQLHDFVVMPNHLHLLITVSGWQNESGQGLKPNHSHACATRLKPCPDTKHQGGDSRKPPVSSGTSSLKCRNSSQRGFTPLQVRVAG